MKNLYSLLLTFVSLICYDHAFAQFGSDVKILNRPAMTETALSMDVAFNGWVYAVVSDDSGYTIRKSTNNGDTWTTFYRVAITDGTYPFVKLVVAGTDKNNLTLVLAGVLIPNTSTGSVIYINRFNATTGAFIDQPYWYGAYSVPRGIDLATDYKNPSTASAPYSIGLVYAEAGTYDSLVIVTSNNAGTTWNSPEVLDTTSRYFFNPSMAYGRSTGWNAGRFFVAYNRYQFSADQMGQVRFVYTPVTTPYVVGPYNIDGLNSSTLGVSSHPKISCSESVDNDSTGITAVIAFQRYYNGGTDQDIWYAHNMNVTGGGTWLLDYIDNSFNVTQQPDVSFDPTYSNFLFTYFDSTTGKMPFLVQNFNIENSPMVTISKNYVDDTTSLIKPLPIVKINPAQARVAMAWLQKPSGATSQAMFDAEYRLPVPTIISINPDTVNVGSAGFTMGIKGTNFVNSSAVTFNGAPATTTFITTDSLTIPVSAMDLTSVGTAGITVFNPTTTGGGGNSNGVIFYIVGPGGISEPTLNGIINVYPNPVANTLNLSYAMNVTSAVDISMYDMQGNLVKTLAHTTLAGNGVITTDVSSIANGIYQIVMQNADSRNVKQINVAH